MTQDFTTIGLSGVNCYLLRAGEGFVLIDTGLATKREALESALDARRLHAGQAEADRVDPRRCRPRG